jgi:hypothetical protein
MNLTSAFLLSRLKQWLFKGKNPFSAKFISSKVEVSNGQHENEKDIYRKVGVINQAFELNLVHKQE